MKDDTIFVTIIKKTVEKTDMQSKMDNPVSQNEDHNLKRCATRNPPNKITGKRRCPQRVSSSYKIIQTISLRSSFRTSHV